MSAKTELGINFRGIDKTAGVLRGIEGGINGLVKKAAGLMAGVFAFHKGKELIATLSGMEESAMKMGTNTETFQQLSNAFTAMGLNAETAGKAFAMLQKNLGSGKKSKAFEAIGLDVARLKMLKPDEIFKEVGYAIAKLPTEADRANAAMATFGKAGKDMLPFFRQGPEAFSEGFGSLMEMLPVFSEESISAAHDLEEGFHAVGQILKVDLVNAFMDVSKSGGDAFGSIGASIIKSYYGVKLFIQNTATLFVWLKDFIMENFKDLPLDMDPTDVLAQRMQTNIEKNMKESSDAIARFTAGESAKKKFRTPIDHVADTTRRLLVTLKDVKQAMSEFGAMSLSGSYSAIQSQFGALQPSVAGSRLADPFAQKSGGQAILEQLYVQMVKIAKNTETTADNTDEIEGEF